MMKANKLGHMTDIISVNLEDLLVTGNGDYEYSSSCGGSKAKVLSGLWKVDEHTIGGTAYATKFAEAKFGEAQYSEPVYESTFEFIKNICIKRVMIYTDIKADDGEKPMHYDYRMSLVFIFELHKNSINVLPVLGYQSASINGQPGAVKELPPSNEWISIDIKFGQDSIILEDGNDIKKLGRCSL